jgi:hypothetical protein
MNQKEDHPIVGIGDWLITLIITAIPVLGFIMLLFWAFDKGTNPSKANWAKSRLVVMILVYGIFFMIISLIGLTAILGLFEEYYDIEVTTY